MKIRFNTPSTAHASLTSNQEADSSGKNLDEASPAIDHFSALPSDMHRKIICQSNVRTINKLKSVSHFLRAQVEDPMVQAACAKEFAYRYVAIAKWSPLLRASVNAQHELIPSDALLAAGQSNFRIFNPMRITIVLEAQRRFTSARYASLRHNNRTIGVVQLQPPRLVDDMRLIGLNDHNGQIVGFGKIGSIYRNYQIETFLPSPDGLVKRPELLKELRNRNLGLGSEYFMVFENRNGGKTIGLMEVPQELEACRRNLEVKLACTDDEDSVDGQ